MSFTKYLNGIRPKKNALLSVLNDAKSFKARGSDLLRCRRNSLSALVSECVLKGETLLTAKRKIQNGTGLLTVIALFFLVFAGCQSPGTVSFYNPKPLNLPAPVREDPENSLNQNSNVMRGQSVSPSGYNTLTQYNNTALSGSVSSVPAAPASVYNTPSGYAAETVPAPSAVAAPISSVVPAVSAAPSSVAAPMSSAVPAVSAAPSAVAAPMSSAIPAVSAAPSSVAAPMSSAVPAVSAAPSSVAAPMSSVVPAVSATPSSVAAPMSSAVPAVSAAPSSVAAPMPSVVPAFPVYPSSIAGTVPATPPVSTTAINTKYSGTAAANNSYGSGSGTSSVSGPGTKVALVSESGQTVPPASNDLPRFARNSYDNSLENLDAKRKAPGTGTSNFAEPNRQSLTDKVQVEKELEEKYQAWLKSKQTEKQVKGQSFLDPLSDDRAVFDDPNSPFARKTKGENDKRFVREITAADLSMMSEVSSRKELLDWEKDEKTSSVDWSKYSASTLWSKWKDFAGMSPNEKEANVIMKEATEEHGRFEDDKDKKHLTKAADLYEKAGRRWPDSILEEDALFYSGECSFFAENYPRAMRCYKQLVTKYTNSVLKKQAVERLYYIGCYWVKCSEEDHSIVNISDKTKPSFSSFSGAKKAFEAVYLNDTSDNGRAPDALFALGNAYMRRACVQGDASYESAARYYRQLYEFYPASKHTEKAYQLAIIALHKSYRGPSYDSRTLKQAVEIAKAAQGAGKGDQKLIQEELESIRGEQATQMMFRGKYYEKRGNYASARAYYNRLARDFPEHDLSQEAAKRYAEIKDRPAEEDQYAWIRPVLPFIPKSDNVYYEDHPEKQVQEAIVNSEKGKISPAETPGDKFSDLDKSKPENKKKLF